MDAQSALSLASAVITILSKIGSAPVVLVLVVIVVGPWAFALVTSWHQAKRFDAMKTMYESNVKLVDCYENLAKGQAEMIGLNTAKWMEATDAINMNQYCPLIRLKKERVEVKDL